MPERTEREANAAIASAIRGLAVADALRIAGGTGPSGLPAVLTATPLEAAGSEADYLREVFEAAGAEYDREGC